LEHKISLKRLILKIRKNKEMRKMEVSLALH